jgi:hypothetical protein
MRLLSLLGYAPQSPRPIVVEQTVNHLASLVS